MKNKRIILFDTIFLSIIILLVILSIFSYKRINDLTLQNNLVENINQIKFQLQQADYFINDAEKEQRFFFLTKNNIYLSTYLSALNKSNHAMADIEEKLKDNKEQHKNIVILKALTTKKFQPLTASSISSISLVAADIIIMKQIDQTILKMIKIEDDLLVRRNDKKNYAVYITPYYSLLISVLAIFIVAAGYFLFKNETSLRFNIQSKVAKLNDYFKDLPGVFAIVKGPNHVHELANNLYQNLGYKRNVIGKSFKEVFPEFADQGFFKLLDNVYTSGEAYIGKEIPVLLAENAGTNKKAYYNFIYQPIFNQQKKIEGILIFGYDITEMVAARTKIEETEQQSNLAIMAGNIGTFEWDLKNDHLANSPRLLEIFGFNRTDDHLTHEQFFKKYHPDDLALRNEAVANSFITKSLQYEARIIWPDNSIRWINVHAKIFGNEAQENLKMYGTAVDITEQKKLMEELRESERSFRLLSNSMPQFVWTSDVKGNLDYFNQAVYDYSGRTAEDFPTNEWLSIVHPDDRTENVSKWINAITNGTEFIFEHRFRNHAGNYRWQLSRALPQYDDNGKINRWVGTSTDIDDQKNLSDNLAVQVTEHTQELTRLNKGLQLKNSIFAQAEENALIGSYSWDLENGNQEYSDNLFRLFGYKPNEIVPSLENFYALIHPDDREKMINDADLELMKSKKIVVSNYRIFTKDGQLKNLRSIGKIIGKNESMLIGTVQDISQDIFLNEVLRVKNIELLKINAELESFNYVASHDLQEPLRKIQAFSQRILQQEGSKFSSAAQHYFSRIIASAERMQNLINALISYAHADAITKETISINLNTTLKQVKNDLQELVDEKNATIIFEQLPVINAVDVQIHQLFINLITNALKYSKEGVDPIVEITATCIAGSEIENAVANKKIAYWHIRVSDNGIGFEQEYEHKIFELFQRLHNGNEYTGTGIGLSICKKIVLNHQGFILASGIPGIGSQFNIYFPMI